MSKKTIKCDLPPLPMSNRVRTHASTRRRSMSLRVRVCGSGCGEGRCIAEADGKRVKAYWPYDVRPHQEWICANESEGGSRA